MNRRILRLLFIILPLVERELQRWRGAARAIPNSDLSHQALESIRTKRFHCQGGSLFASMGSKNTTNLVRAIVALQTISDYLDNLCDRLGVADEMAFRDLHRAFTDALTGRDTESGAGFSYYCSYPLQSDGGYLSRLVETCKENVSRLPRFNEFDVDAVSLASFYCDLQSLKHLGVGVREERLRRWALGVGEPWPEVEWWEVAAACGSTLGIFAIMACAADPGFSRREVKEVIGAYFPWICSLHILLDYLIDLSEDKHHGDFNFVACYGSQRIRDQRLLFLLKRALIAASQLKNSGFHILCIQGLLALYLSDPKVEANGLKGIALKLLEAGGPGTKGLWRLCRTLRRVGVV